MISPADVSAVIVTRGDIDLTPVLNSLPFEDVVVWNNAERQDLSCYGRFAGIAECRHDTIYVQDDDVTVPARALLDLYDPADRTILANKKPDEEWRFLGVGALFPREFAASPFDRYTERYGDDAEFRRVSDVVFAYQLPYRSVWVGYEDLPWQTADNRMYKQPGHYETRIRARDRIIRDGWLVP